MNPASWSVRNRVAVNLLTGVILATGFFLGIFKVPRSLFPDITWNFVVVTVLDRTNSLPEDIERLVAIPLEEGLASVKNVRESIVVAQPNLVSFFMQTEPRADPQAVLNDVRQQVARVRNRLPPTIEEPVIELFDAPFPIFSLGVTLPPGVAARELRTQLERLERDIRLIAGVDRVTVDGLERREVWIEIDPDLAVLRGISPATVIDAVRNASADTVAGRQRAEGGERIIRLLVQPENVEAFASIPVGTDRAGRTVFVRDIASTRETTEEARSRARLNLRPGVAFSVFRQQGSDARKVAASIREAMAEAVPTLPEGSEIVILSDATLPIDIRLDTVMTNGLQALLVITLLLVVFLNWRLAMIVAVGLPISIAGVFIVLYAGGKTLDVLSLFAVIMALGMLVDDAIVVAENVYRLYERGLPPVRAAVEGTMEVIRPVLGSVATTIAAFLPLLLGEGIIGRVLFIVPVVVVTALLFSLIQAFIVLPSHLCDFVRHPPDMGDLERRAAAAPRGRRLGLQIALVYWETRRAVDRSLDRLREVYLFFLKGCLRRRYLVVLGFGAAAAGSMGLVGAGVIPFRLFDTDFADRAFVKLDLPAGASLDQTEDAVAAVERAILAELPADDIKALLSQVGRRLNESDDFELLGSNLAMITVDIDTQNPRARPASAIERDLSRVLTGFPEFVRTSAQKEGAGPPVGRPVNVIISGDDFDTLRALADKTRRRLTEVPGILNVADNFNEGQPEWRLRLDQARAIEAGLDPRTTGVLLTAAYAGVEAARLRWDDNEVILRVRYPESVSRDPERLLGLRVASPGGSPVALRDLVDLEFGAGLSRITRRNQSRTITVSGDVDPRVITSVQINRMLGDWMPDILADHPGYTYRLAGENEDTRESLEAMALASLLAVALIYTILAVLFNSFGQPLVVMAVIPFGIVGVIGGLLFMGDSMGLMSILGTIALAGIVVNNSVVFLDFINNFRRANPLEIENDREFRHFRFDRWYSILRAAQVRLRPIILTTVTTVAGLWGLAFFSSGQEEFLAPMAKAIIWGLIFATMITLILIPCLYSILDDFVLRRIRRRIKKRLR